MKKWMVMLFGALAVFMLLVAAPVAMAVPTTPTADFTDNGDGTVTHRITGLTWMRCAMGMIWDGATCTGTANTYTWDQAVALTANFAGKSDWRLPSIAELNGIVEREAFSPAINGTIFPNTPASLFWSASAYANDSSLAWVVDFYSGYAYDYYKSFAYRVRLVRAGQSFDSLASYTPTADFIDNHDGTVTHRKTGLMWKRCAEGQVWSNSSCSGTAAFYDWNTAVALTSSSAGHTDWRLPTENELLSIVEYRTYNPAINTTIFPNTPASLFWSASAGAGYSGSAWYVHFGYGGAYGSYGESYAYQVRLVRAGQFFGSLGFTPQIGVAPNAAIASNALSVTGIGSATPISIAGGSYAINGGAFITAAGTVNPNDSVTVRITSSPNPSTTTRATLTIGGISGDFSVTTAAADTRAPSVPTNLIATTNSDNLIQLAWSPASDNVGVTAYQLYRNGSWFATLGNVTGYADTGLSAATTYTYQVAACDAANNCSAQGAAASATTPAAHAIKPATPTADFTDNHDGTVTHKITGLTWMRCALGQTWNGSTCVGTVSRYTWDQAVALTATFAGKSDWRLPSITELNSIVEREAHDPAINATIFPNTPASYFWSGSPGAGSPALAWYVYFSNGGSVALSKSFNNYVRLVRGGQSFDSLASYTPTADFTDNGDGTVTHRKTGLMWKRCAEGQVWSGSTCSGSATSYDWNAAVALTSGGAGHNGWRLPTENELLTIVEYQAIYPAINTTIFPNTGEYSYFWSASANANYSNFAWDVYFGSGGADSSFKGNAYQVRLVRARQFFGPLGFTPQTGVAPNSVITSNALIVIGSAAPISITGGSYAINGGAYTTAVGTVNPNDSITVRITALSILATTTRATLTIGGISGDFSVTTLADTQLPTVPDTLTATAASASQINLSWSSASDSVGVTNYRLYRNGVLLTTVGNVTGYSDTQLAGATRFNYSAVACDAANNCSASSNVATVTISGAAKMSPLLAAGANHGAGLKNDGSLLLWGYNDSGQLGNGATTGSRSWPQAAGTGFSAVALGGSHSAAIKTDGSLWTWGGNASGQLGDGTTSIRTSPAPVGTGYITVAAGDAHTLAIKDDGSLWAWGKNSTGQIGDGTSNPHNSPTQIGTGFYAVAAGTSHSVALKTDGTLWAWGSNANGQLGDGTNNDRYAPTLIGSGFTAVVAGAYHTLALKADGSLWAWGKNDTGQLGDGTLQIRFAPTQIGTGFSTIAAGASHSLALKPDGSVWAWGSNASGQLGDGTTTDHFAPTQIPGLSGVVAIVAGGNNSFAIKSDGSVFSWGANNVGQLGDGTFARHLSPVLVMNETVDGFLNLTPGIDFEVPPSAGVPYFAVASGGITDTSATVNTTIKFNAADVGKQGEVYVTAIVPSGYLAPTQSAIRALGAAGSGIHAQNVPTYELVQLTSLGLQPVMNGQLIPHATGVLGDQFSEQSILNNIDTANLKGAQFCVGYGTSAEQMIATGMMRVIATIPDPSGANAGMSCIVSGPPVNYSLVLKQGWNLLGNSLNQTLSVASLYGDAGTVTTVWKWDATRKTWQFYTPSMDAAALQTYATNKGYGVLSEIKPGDGYWVNAKAQPALAAQAGDSFILTSPSLAKGWNLVATGNDITPPTFNTNLKSSLPGTGVTTLWAWDNALSSWYFYAPSLEAQGGTALADYIASKSYLDFAAANKKLGNGTGFWVNRP